MPSDLRDRSPPPYSRRAAAAASSPHRSRSPRRRSSRSHSPAEGHRFRSRSPKPRSPPPADEAKSRKKIPSGFKFKEKSQRGITDETGRDQTGRGLERGYRERGGDTRPEVPSKIHDPIAEKFGAGASVKDKFGDVKVAEISTTSPVGEKAKEDGKKEKKKRDKNKASTTQPLMEMIIVYVNDRLGTRAEIKCSSSDTIKDFKAFVAHKIGRKPHEIMVKRQGERPFKDQLTLEDYGVGNGVQLDLELDTGD